MIIAIDFDGTIVEHRYPAIGKELPFALETIKALQKKQHQIILWTYRSGKTLEEARISLAAAGLLISKTQPVDSNQAPGVILQSDPVPGTTVPAGSGVVLQIASGQVQVPQLLGLTEIEAQTVLTQGGFLSHVIYAYQADKPLDLVLAQAPDAGTSANIGSVITVTVNKNV